MADPGAIKSGMKRSRTVTIGGRIVLHAISGVRERVGRSGGTIGATHRGLDLDSSVAYVDAVYDDYLRYARLSPSDLEGARVLEVGAGDNFGVALRLLAGGADRVVAVDRFETWRDPAQQRAIYGALLERMDSEERARASAAVELSDGVRFDPERLAIVEGLPIEAAARRFETGSFDLVVSRAVMEHVGDIPGAFAAMDSMLAPTGTMAHKVDLSDHGLFTPGGHHPLTFLTVSDRVYRWMGGDAGLPNRHLMNEYRDELRRLGYEPDMLVTHLIGHGEEIVPHVSEPSAAITGAAEALAEELRPRLLDRYRDRDARELAVSGIFVVGRRT